MKVLVTGSRWYTNESELFYHLDQLLDGQVVLSGGEAGPARLAIKYAQQNGLDAVCIKPEFLVGKHREFDQRDFFSRNYQLVDNCDGALLFWDGSSTEVRDIVRLCKKLGKPYQIVDILKENDNDS